ncbi:MAG: helix-turn-helix domain-containing protein [Pseudomonadota bacterium]
MKNPHEQNAALNSISGLESVDPIKDLAKVVLSQNRKRGLFLPQLEWGEPSWYVMLDLFVAEIEKLDTSPAAIAHRNNIPQSSARRYIALMIDRGLLEQVPSETPGQEPGMRLTRSAKHGLVLWIRNVMSSMAREF